MLLEKRFIYKPFEYPQAMEFWEKQHAAHWLPSEVSLSGDVIDWKTCSEKEKLIITKVLNGFTQTEVIIEDYWSNKVAKWFKKPEIQNMARTFSAFESIHAEAYSLLNTNLNIYNFESFLYEPIVKNKLDYLLNLKGKTKEEIAISLAIFSAFTEGVNLFCSFCILMNFSRFNKFKGITQLISWSIRDESLHSKAGCWLLNTFIKEYPEIWTNNVKNEIYEAAKLIIENEIKFIDYVFGENKEILELNKEDLKNYIKNRCNNKLKEINLKPLFKGLNKSSIELISNWFDVFSNGIEHADFFSQRVTEYSKSTINFDDI